MDVSVVVRSREDGSSTERILDVAAIADHLGYEELWIGEGPTWDAFVLATAIGNATGSAALTVGPVPASVRDPATISRGASSVAAVTGRRVGVALGSASVRVVEKLHGRSRSRPVSDLRAAAEAIRHLIDTPPQDRWRDDDDAVFLRRLGAPDGPLTVAAFGNRAIQVAADFADRMLLDLVTPEQVASIRARLDEAGSGRPVPKLAAWLPVAVEPTDEAILELKRSIAGYLTIGGYKEMFSDAGMGDAVAMAETETRLDLLARAIPTIAASCLGFVGDSSDVSRQLAAYDTAGLDEVALVPMTAGDTSGERSLRAFKALA